MKGSTYISTYTAIYVDIDIAGTQRGVGHTDWHNGHIDILTDQGTGTKNVPQHLDGF